MDPEAGVSRDASHHSTSSPARPDDSSDRQASSPARPDGSSGRQGMPMVTDADIETAIQKWGIGLRSASQSKERSSRTLEKFGSLGRSSRLGGSSRWTLGKFGSLGGSSRRILGKFGSQSSVSVLDVIAAGGQIDRFPFYDIIVNNLTYKVAVKSKERKETQKTLLNSVNAEAYHAEIMAIVGPSGSGKTTLIDALAGRVASSSLEGAIFVNGELIDESFKRISGYVMQDDNLFPMLTVRETLLYSARLRLSSEMSLLEKKTRVDNMIRQLGLLDCADTIVGNDKVRGVSGGERRRVSIGSDLIHDPAVLFLDEPTSGLDSTSALNVMQNLRTMAQSGRRTVILTIHQPSYRILDTIDRVLVLGMGTVIYHGPPEGIKHFFDPLGRSMPQSVNVLEYALDTIEEYQRSPQGLEPLISLQESNKQALDDAKVARGSPQAQSMRAERSPVYATPFLSEWFVLASRNLKNTKRTPELFLSRVGMFVVIGATVGTLFLRSEITAQGVKQRAAFFAYTLAVLIFTSTAALGVFIQERQIFVRETSRGAYRATSFVLAGAVVVLPSLLILALLFSIIGYFLVGLVPTVGAFFFFVMVVWLTLCVGNSYVSFISSIAPNFTVGTSICSGTLAYFFLFAGFFVPRTAIPKYWIWLHYISPFKYPYESMLENEFGNKRFDNIEWGNMGSSEEVLISFSAGAVHQWVNILAMVGMILGYRIFFWLVLKYLTTSIRK